MHGAAEKMQTTRPGRGRWTGSSPCISLGLLRVTALGAGALARQSGQLPRIELAPCRSVPWPWQQLKSLYCISVNTHPESQDEGWAKSVWGKTKQIWNSQCTARRHGGRLLSESRSSRGAGCQPIFGTSSSFKTSNAPVTLPSVVAPGEINFA